MMNGLFFMLKASDALRLGKQLRVIMIKVIFFFGVWVAKLRNRKLRRWSDEKLFAALLEVNTERWRQSSLMK